MTVAGGLCSDEWNYGQGMAQGRPESAHIWVSVSRSIIEQLAESWVDRDMGVKLSDGLRISHLWFADNLWLVASSLIMLCSMLQETTVMLRSLGLNWKRSKKPPHTAVEIISSEELEGTRQPIEVDLPQNEKESLECKHVSSMKALGYMIDNGGPLRRTWTRKGWQQCRLGALRSGA